MWYKQKSDHNVRTKHSVYIIMKTMIIIMSGPSIGGDK